MAHTHEEIRRGTVLVTRTSCGDFRRNGFRGTERDYLTHDYFACRADKRYPTRITMATDVFGAFFRASAERAFPQRDGTTEEIIQHVLDVVRSDGRLGDLRLYDAVVEQDHHLRDGTVLFFRRNGELVGEQTGWEV